MLGTGSRLLPQAPVSAVASVSSTENPPRHTPLFLSLSSPPPGPPPRPSPGHPLHHHHLHPHASHPPTLPPPPSTPHPTIHPPLTPPSFFSSQDSLPSTVRLPTKASNTLTPDGAFDLDPSQPSRFSSPGTCVDARFLYALVLFFFFLSSSLLLFV